MGRIQRNLNLYTSSKLELLLYYFKKKFDIFYKISVKIAYAYLVLQVD